MSGAANHRRGEARRQDNGPTWESHTPAAGCNSTHVARSRAKWKRRAARAERRTGENWSKFHGTRYRVPPLETDVDLY